MADFCSVSRGGPPTITYETTRRRPPVPLYKQMLNAPSRIYKYGGGLYWSGIYRLSRQTKIDSHRVDRIIKLAAATLLTGVVISGAVLAAGCTGFTACVAAGVAASLIQIGYRIYRSRPIGVQPPEEIRRNQLALDDRKGTPGVNFKGQSVEDRAIVNARIHEVQTHITPHAHTKGSYDDFIERISRITGIAISNQHQSSIEDLQKSHLEFRDKMIHRFGRQLNVVIIGAGPIGLAAAIMYYRLGFHVECYEQRKEDGSDSFATRRQPFSLMRQGYWFLNSLGVTHEAILNAFGKEVTESDAEFSGGKRAAEVSFETGPTMETAKKRCIGERAASYIPQSLSLPIMTMQRLLLDVITKIDSPSINVVFDHKLANVCQESCRSLDITNSTGTHQIFGLVRDIIYNATGGKESFGDESEKVAQFYGMGAFFSPDENSQTAHNNPIQLSRAVRVFCSFKAKAEQDEKGQPDNSLNGRVTREPVYVGIELTEAEYKDKAQQQKVITQVAKDIGLKETTDYFTVPIELQQIHTAAYKIKSNKSVPQMTIHGGDSLLRPHFLTASGANFGLLGLLELSNLTNNWIYGRISQDKLITQYNSMAKLLQRQSNQMILNLFGRPLV